MAGNYAQNYAGNSENEKYENMKIVIHLLYGAQALRGSWVSVSNMIIIH